MITLISASIYTLVTKDDYILKMELVDVSLNGYGFFVWDEEVYPINNDRVASYAKVDGATIQKEELVAEVYQRSNAADIEHESNEIEIEIFEIQNRNLSSDKELNNMTYQLNNYFYDLQNKAMDNQPLQQIGEMLSVISNEYEKRNDYMDVHVEPTDSLLELYDDEADCIIRLNNQIDRIIAPRNGKIFFSIDGYEKDFEYNNIDYIKAMDGDLAVKANFEGSNRSYDELLPSFFKIVDANSCYYVVNIDSEIIPIKGTAVEVEFPTISVDNVQALIYNVEKTDAENLWTIKLKIDNPPEELFNNRTSEMYILYRETGVYIPNECTTGELKPKVSVLSSDLTSHEDVVINPFLKTRKGFYIKLEDNDKLKINSKIKIFQ